MCVVVSVKEVSKVYVLYIRKDRKENWKNDDDGDKISYATERYEMVTNV